MLRLVPVRGHHVSVTLSRIVERFITVVLALVGLFTSTESTKEKEMKKSTCQGRSQATYCRFIWIINDAR